MRTVSLVLALLLPLAAAAQTASAPPLPERPRALALFDGLRGYADFPPDRTGTPAQPHANELGFSLVIRMFRTVCMDLEDGAPLDGAMPDGFAPYPMAVYYWGPDAEPKGDIVVLSSTGSIDRDEAEGRPAFWLTPSSSGMGCQVEWTIASELSPSSQSTMVEMIEHWLPWRMALVRADRPNLVPEPAPFGLIEWDRPCGNGWCAVTARYDLPGGTLALDTKLAIADFGGARP